MPLAVIVMAVLTAHAARGCQATSSAGRQLQQGSSSSTAASARAGKRHLVGSLEIMVVL